MQNKIKQIKLKKFRGATDETTIEFDCQKRMVVIFGENGTGKTTILDAIDFACNKNNEVSLKNKSVGLQKYKYLPSISSQPSSLEVEIETTTKAKCTAKFGSRGDVVVNAGLPQVKILRRDSILKIVTGQPKERFDEIRDMVSYPKIKQIEDALREAQKAISKNYDEATTSYQQEETNLKNAWQEVSDKTKDFLAWAQERSLVNKDGLEKEKNSWETRRKKAQDLKSKTETLEGLKTTVASTKESIEVKDQELQEKVKNEAEKQGLVPLLEKAKSYIEGQAVLSECPVCSSDINRDKILSDISSRIDQMKDLKTIQDDLGILVKQKESQEGQITSTEMVIDNLVKEIQFLFEEAEQKPLKDPNAILGCLSDWEQRAFEKREEFYQLALIQLRYKTFYEKKEEAEKSAKKVGVIQELLHELEAIRKQAVDEILKDISLIVETIYSSVHPNEGIGLVNFYLDPKKAESLEFNGAFQGDSVPPQAYYSDSHLDTLGICIFVALWQYKCSDGIVLLDDVLTSVDQQHMNRLIDMLEGEVKNFAQIIITTHYRPWRERYRLPVQQSSDVELIELLPWATDSGVRHTRTKFYVDEIRESIAETPFDPQKTASKAGILLEHLLDEIVLKYSLNVPRKPLQKYTLNELFYAIDSKMRKLLNVIKSASSPVNLQSNLDGLQNTIFVRNDVGCHYSEAGSLLSDVDVQNFGNQVITFADLLLCDSCGAFPNKNRTGSYWECKCGTLKLNPLQRV